MRSRGEMAAEPQLRHPASGASSSADSAATLAAWKVLRPAGLLLRVAVWMALGAGAGVFVAATGPVLLGLRSFVVSSGSMEPAIRTGDVVVDSRIHPLSARTGDVVTFRDPQVRGRLISHRVRAVRRSGGLVELTTKGDANNTTERWTVASGGQIGRVRYRVPRVGYALVFARTPYGRVLLVGFLLAALGGWALVRIWSAAPEEGRDDTR